MILVAQPEHLFTLQRVWRILNITRAIPRALSSVQSPYAHCYNHGPSREQQGNTTYSRFNFIASSGLRLLEQPLEPISHELLLVICGLVREVSVNQLHDEH